MIDEKDTRPGSPRVRARLRPLETSGYASFAVTNEQLMRLLDSPLPWGLAGFFLGLGVGATAASVWPVAIGLLGYLVYLGVHGPARPDTETRLSATGPTLLVTWMLGVVVHGWAF